MKDLIEELSYIVDDKPIKSDAFSKMCDIEDILTEKLIGDDKKIFLDFVKARDQAAREYSVVDFKRGFEAGFWFKQELSANDETA
ncbi:MAG: hypothetical protein LBC86_08005 [Oscillospiraceae bacterium]|jgi:hypothetical protein|nr:hypothetical protein [Oscillospiraceae bacterium]